MNGKKILKLMFSLDEFVIPSIIRVLYILSFLFIILYSLYDAFGDIRYSFRSFSWDIILMFLRLLALRISTEILYLWFASSLGVSFIGGTNAGINKIFGMPKCFITYSAIYKCPLWIGLKVPEKMHNSIG